WSRTGSPRWPPSPARRCSPPAHCSTTRPRSPSRRDSSSTARCSSACSPIRSLRRKGERVARPKVPLISKRAALDAALAITDTDGIDALSIRRLAERLGVNGASLYHHFQNKEEIVVGAAKLALEEVRAPQGHEEPWEVWLLRNARRLRAAFRAHPDLV